jgi:hypothetical protein
VVESTAANPQLLADQVSSLLVQPLEAASVVLSSGPRIFDTAGVLRLPKLTKSSTGFIGESELIPSDHDTTFDELVVMPTSRKSIKVIERYSRELARQAVIGIDATLKNRLVKVVSDKLDTALLVGRGQATNEVQTVTITGSPTGGTFTPPFRGATTSGLAYNAASSAVQTALQGLSTIGSGNATVAGSAGGPYTVMFASSLAATAVDEIIASGASLTGGTNPSVSVVTATEGEAANGITGLINQSGVQTGELDVTGADGLLDDRPGVSRRSHPEPLVRQRHRLHCPAQAQRGIRLGEVSARVRRHRRPDLPAVRNRSHRHEQAKSGQGDPG